ncbi:hypothetical protein LUZ60_000910 [Juncus effusus]|nr:hypothetical protein LUZ60_000910 [Juncus effusus]
MAPSPLELLSSHSSRLNPLQNPNHSHLFTSTNYLTTRRVNGRKRSGSCCCYSVMSLKSKPNLRYAVLGAGFAGLSVAWHILNNCAKGSHVCVDIYDENGIGGGASGVAGGLLHPYSPKAKLLWKGGEFWKECLELIAVAEQANRNGTSEEISCYKHEHIVLRRGILRPATSEKNVQILTENAGSCLAICALETLNKKSVQHLIPGLNTPFNLAIYMPSALNIDPKRYMQALFTACQNFAKESSSSGVDRNINLYKQPVNNLQNLSGEYHSVIVCLGARANMLPELSGKLPFQTCRGVIAELQLPTNISGEYSDQSPSILSDAWLAFQGPRNVYMGSTWDWNSTNYNPFVSKEESSKAMEELMRKISVIYPEITKWSFVGAKAGLRAMPPLTEIGSVPLLGCLNELIRVRGNCRVWLIGGLGARGLLYHGLLGKLTAQAVVSCDESLIPLEFVDWKRKNALVVN